MLRKFRECASKKWGDARPDDYGMTPAHDERFIDTLSWKGVKNYFSQKAASIVPICLFACRQATLR
ncbi:MAG: hypothetical protein IJ599_03515 [Alphaproteobacteria bacterium]|nr:hypothetical protein [Alphaproteobacteria bacterium]